MPELSDALETLINQGHYFEARSKAAEMINDSTSMRSKQLYALAVSKCGLPEAAMQFLEPIHKQFPDDPETAGILGGIYKEIFIKTKDQRYAILSKDTYLKNFTATKSYYTGINAATMSAISGQSKQAQQIAAELLALLNPSSQDFWQTATRAEALLISKDRVKAKEVYLQARNLVGTDWGKINSIYNQLWLLNHYLAVPNELLKIFKPPVIAAFVGHMIDHPSRTQSRFPASIEHKVKEALSNSITAINAKIGYCSLACGGDILFAEAMLETGGEVNIYLPFLKSDFLDASVRFAGEQWVERFEKLSNRFSVNYITHEPYDGYSDLFFLQTGIIFGTATMRGKATHTKPHLVTILSGLDLKRKEGGTLDTLQLWPYPETILNINPDNFNPTSQSNNRQEVPISIAPDKNKNRPVLYLIMADFPNLPLAEKEICWKSVQAKIEIQSPLPRALTWKGDHLLAAYVALEGTVALCHTLVEMVSRFHKKDQVRISLHVGPVQVGQQEVLGEKIEGNQVKILSQIHSFAACGEIYASSQYSMELALDLENYSIDYAGKFLPDGVPQSQEIFKIGFTK